MKEDMHLSTQSSPGNAINIYKYTSIQQFIKMSFEISTIAKRSRRELPGDANDAEFN